MDEFRDPRVFDVRTLQTHIDGLDSGAQRQSSSKRARVRSAQELTPSRTRWRPMVVWVAAKRMHLKLAGGMVQR